MVASATPLPVIGVPVPGTELKLVPSGSKLEIRVRGPNVTPGYWKRDDLTKSAFDDEGFYRIGDAVKLAKPDDPSAGVMFDGRVAEDFKLSTGTWVSAGAVRVRLIAAADPLIQDAVITGHDRNEIGALVFLSPAAKEVAQIGAVIGREFSLQLLEMVSEVKGDRLLEAVEDDEERAEFSDLQDALSYLDALYRRTEIGLQSVGEIRSDVARRAYTHPA